jgi:anaerobic magnesium-protoporphyrin IX monomethyl ester cyclase
MRILLVQAFTALDMELVYPIGLAYLAAHLDGHEVRIFDVNLHARTDPFGALESELRGFDPDVVGISLRNIKVAKPGSHEDDFAPQQKTIALVRRVCPKAITVAGGTAFSLYAEEFMKRLPELDFGVWGEAETRFPELVAKPDRPWEVPGVYYRKDGKTLYSGAPPAVDFKKLKHPRRDLCDHAPYVASSFVSVGVQSKRGCALHCIHCSDTYLLGHAIRKRPAADVVDEIQELVEKWGVNQLFFCDQIFNIPPGHAIDICNEITRRNLDVQWSAWFNEHRNTLPDELMIALKEAGCGLLSFSPDHVDDRMLANLDKNFRYTDMLYTIEVAKKFDFDVEYSFFLNSPGEDARSLLKIFEFLARAKWQLGPRLRMFTLLMMQPIRLYPHTRLAELARETGLVDKDHSLIEGQFWNPGALSYAVAGVQAGASFAYDLRQRMKRLRGPSGPVTVARKARGGKSKKKAASEANAAK